MCVGGGEGKEEGMRLDLSMKSFFLYLILILTMQT